MTAPARRSAQRAFARDVAAAFLAALATTIAPTDIAWADDVFDRIVAVVDQAVITQSEVDRFARIRLVRLQRYGEAVAPLTAPARNAAVENLVNQALIYEEARRLAVQQISLDEITRQMSDFRKRFPSEGAHEAFMRDHEIATTDLQSIFQRMLLCDRFARDTVGVGVKINDAMIADYIARHKDSDALRGKRAEDQKELARISVFRPLFDVELLRWMTTLRKRAKLRILIIYR